MSVNEMIYKLRTSKKMSQEEFASVFSVSRQSVQKWESGAFTPELSKLIEISNYFGITLDALVLNREIRILEEMNCHKKELKPDYENTDDWTFYASYPMIMLEYKQSYEEGYDIEAYKDFFNAVANLPKGDAKKMAGDIVFKIVSEAKLRNGYEHNEPSDLEGIRKLRKEYIPKRVKPVGELENKIYGAWLGRICGCMLGKTIEGIRTDELVPFLKETDNYPLHRYILQKDITDDTAQKYKFSFAGRRFADEIDGMPYDDDTNYTVMAQVIIDKYGRDFTPYDVSRAWLNYQAKGRYCSAEQIAFCNFVNDFLPPQSAMYKNPYREWIGAQIRADYFGYINPGNPELAAEMAWRDASISHVKNGIYGEMFVAAMLANAAVTDDIEDIIRSGLAQIPYSSRLYKAVCSVLDEYKAGVPQEKCFERIHDEYDEYTSHGWCHVISNAMIVVASLLYGKGDYAKSICMSVETGFDTDCNGATVGSVLGLAFGKDIIPAYWSEPFNDILHTSLLYHETLKISELVKKTMEHIAKK